MSFIDYDSLAKDFGVSLPRPKQVDDKDNIASVLDDEFSRLGYPSTARLSILGDVGRENNWDRNTIFKGHSDPKNNAFNRGIISWQGDRQTKLQNYLKKEGVLGRNDDNELRGMARFMDKELQDDYPDVHKKLKNPASTYDASEALRQYIKYVPDAPYNSHDPEFRVKNNAAWAKRAQKLGLGRDSDFDFLSSQFLSDGDGTEFAAETEDATPDFNVLSQEFGVTLDDPVKPQADPNEPTTEPDGAYPIANRFAPATEHPDTIKMQIQSALDPKVKTRYGVLPTTPEQDAELSGNATSQLDRFLLGDGKPIYVNVRKALKKLGLKDKDHLANYIRKNPKALTTIIGIDPKNDVGDDSRGIAVTAQKNGREAATAVVTGIEGALKQAANYRDQFGEDAQIGLTTSKDIVAQRTMPPIETLGGLEGVAPDTAPPMTEAGGLMFGDPRVRQPQKQPIRQKVGRATPQGRTSEPVISDVDIDPQTGQPIGQPVSQQPPQQAIRADAGRMQAELDQALTDLENAPDDATKKEAQKRIDTINQQLNERSNAVAETIDIPKGLTQEQANRYAIGQLHAKYPSGDFSKFQFLGNYTGAPQTQVSYGDLKRAGVDIEPLIHQKVVEKRVENPEPNLDTGHNWVAEDARRLRDTFGDYAGAGLAEIIASGGRRAEELAGWLRLVDELSPTKGESMTPEGMERSSAGLRLIKELQETGRNTRQLSERSGAKVEGQDAEGHRVVSDDLRTEIIKLGAGLPLDIASIAVHSALPGGAVTGFGAQAAAGTYGRGESGKRALIEGGKGLALGAVFGGMSKFARWLGPKAGEAFLAPETKAALKDPAQRAAYEAAKQAGENVALNPDVKRALVAKTIAEQGLPLGTVIAGGYGISAAAGGDTRENVKTALTFGVLHLLGMAWGKKPGEKFTKEEIDKADQTVIRVPDENGKPRDVLLLKDKNGNLTASDVTGKVPEEAVDVPQIEGSVAKNAEKFIPKLTDEDVAKAEAEAKQVGKLEKPEPMTDAEIKASVRGIGENEAGEMTFAGETKKEMATRQEFERRTEGLRPIDIHNLASDKFETGAFPLDPESDAFKAETKRLTGRENLDDLEGDIEALRTMRKFIDPLVEDVPRERRLKSVPVKQDLRVEPPRVSAEEQARMLEEIKKPKESTIVELKDEVEQPKASPTAGERIEAKPPLSKAVAPSQRTFPKLIRRTTPISESRKARQLEILKSGVRSESKAKRPDSVEATSESESKQPWMMTKADFETAYDQAKTSGKEFAEVLDSEDTKDVHNMADRYIYKKPWAMETYHRATVKRAVRQGKSVPAEVLADYPDLVKASPTADKRLERGDTSRTTVSKKGESKEPWQMTRKEYGVPEQLTDIDVPKLPNLERKAREHPESLTERDREILADVKQKRAQRAKNAKLHKLHVEKSNEHLRLVKQALTEGKAIPDNVLAEYPFLESAPQEQQDARKNYENDTRGNRKGEQAVGRPDTERQRSGDRGGKGDAETPIDQRSDARSSDSASRRGQLDVEERPDANTHQMANRGVYTGADQKGGATPGEVVQSRQGRGVEDTGQYKNAGLTTAEIAQGLNRFSKSGDLRRYARRIKDFTRDEKVRLVENLRAGDDPLEAIKDAKGYEAPFGPGAANVGDVPSASAIKQLGEAIEQITSEGSKIKGAVSATLNRAKGFQEAVAKADAIGTGKGWLNTAMLRMRAGYDWYAKRKPVTDYKKVLGDFLWADQKSAHETRRFFESIKKAVPDARTQEAITNYIQADGDAEILQRWADGSKGRAKLGYERALKLSDNEKVIATQLQSYYEAQLQEGIELGLINDAVENYVNQVWARKDPLTNALRSQVQRSLLDPNFRFSKKRTFQDFFAGEQAGFKPITKQIGDLASFYNQAFERAKFSRQFIKELQNTVAEDGRPAVAISGMGATVPKGEATPDAVLINPKAKTKEIGDYKTIDHPALRGWKWVAGTGEDGTPVMLKGDLVVHPEVYKHLKNVLGTSAMKKHALGRGVLRVQSTLKQTMLSMSGFHQVQEGVHALGHRVSPWRAGGKDFEIDFDDPKQKSLIQGGLQVASHDALGEFSEGITGGNLVNKAPFVGKYFQRYQDWLFKDYIPRLKMVMALHALERNTKRYAKKLDAEQIAELTAEQSNAAFGELNYRHMGRNPTFQDGMRTFLLAPDFLEARGRFTGQALKPFGREQMAALALLAATQFILARLLNQWLDDDPHWDVQDAFRVYYKGHWYGLRTVPGDIIHLVTDPRSFAYHRMSPLMRGGVEAITGRNAFGEKIGPVDVMKDMAPVPLALRRKTDDEWWEPFINSFGIQEGKQKTDADKVIQEYYQRRFPNGFPKSDDPEKAQLKKDALKKIRAGTMTDEELEELNLTPDDIEKLEKTGKLTPLQVKLKTFPVKDAIDVWNAATPAEKAQIRDIVLQKVNKAQDDIEPGDIPDDLQDVQENGKPVQTSFKDDRSFIGRIVTYSKAIGADPVDAFKKWYAGETIRRTDNGIIIVDRMTKEQSQQVKRERGAAKTMRLDHNVPLELGGTNETSNLKLVDESEWARYTPVENALGRELRGGRISGTKARDLLQQFKLHNIGEQDIEKEIGRPIPGQRMIRPKAPQAPQAPKAPKAPRPNFTPPPQ